MAGFLTDPNEWNEELKQKTYRDWGEYYSTRQHFHIAADFYNKSLDLKNNDMKSLYYRSLGRCHLGQIESALEDALAALALNDLSYPVNLQVCDAIYDLNQFEENFMTLFSASLKFGGHKEELFTDRMDIAKHNFIDLVGQYSNEFIKENSTKMNKIMEEVQKKYAIDTRPYWKILKELDKCDATSDILEDEKILNVREEERLKKYYRIFAQVYFLRSWQDIAFVKSLNNEKRYLFPEFVVSFLKSDFATVSRFLKMLHNRSPLYVVRKKMFPNKELAIKFKEKFLYRLQYQTRRDMFHMLGKITQMRKKGQLKKLVNYAEYIMGSYVAKKTARIMPRKFEFVNEIYNIVGLAHCDRINIPKNVFEFLYEDRIFVLMGVPIEKYKSAAVGYIYGDKASFANSFNMKLSTFNKNTSRLENRLKFAKYPIEKCYLLHEIVKHRIKQKRLDESLALAKKMTDEAILCRNSVWRLLASLLICKINATRKKFEDFKRSIIETELIASELNNPRIMHFLKICASTTDSVITFKKLLSEEYVRRLETPTASRSSSLNFPSSRQSLQFKSDENKHDQHKDDDHDSYNSDER